MYFGIIMPNNQFNIVQENRRNIWADLQNFINFVNRLLTKYYFDMCSSLCNNERFEIFHKMGTEVHFGP